MNFKEFILSFRVHTAPIPLTEKIRSAVISGIAIFLLGFAIQFLPEFNFPLAMISSIAASTVLLFVVPHSPMAQPWPVFGGHAFSALAGWLCGQSIQDPVLAAACAVGLAIILMHSFHCLHPPGAATALMLILFNTHFNSLGWAWVTGAVLANTGIALLLALLINNLLPGRHYPMRHTPEPILKTDHLQLKREDIEWALTQIDGVVDVTEEDLMDIYELAIRHAKSQKKNNPKS